MKRNTIILAAATFLIGGGLSSAITVAATPEPEPVKVSDPACVDALEKGDILMGLMEEAIQTAPDSVRAAFDRDVYGMEEQTEIIQGLTGEIETARADYDFAAASCHLGAE